MDTKKLVIGMALAMAVVFGWQALMQQLAKKYNWALTPEQQQSATTQPVAPVTPPPGSPPPSTQTSSTQTSSTQTSTTQGSMSAATGPAMQVASTPSSTQPTAVVLGSKTPKDGAYVLGLEISARGAGLQGVTLNQFWETIEKRKPYTFQTPLEGWEDISRPLATRWITVDGARYDLNVVTWTLRERTERTATFSVDLQRGGRLVLRVLKKFEVFGKDNANRGYEVQVTQSYENLGKAALKVQADLVGPLVPPQEISRGVDRVFIGGYNVSGELTVEHHAIEDLTKDKPAKALDKSDKGAPMVWMGASSVYFSAIVLPTEAKGAAEVKSNYIEKAEAQLLNPGDKVEDHKLITEVTTKTLDVPAGSTVSLPLQVFFGPKQRDLLASGYYEADPRHYEKSLVYSSSCNFCTFGWLVNVLVTLLGAFHWVFGGFVGHGDWGLAIIALVLVVRLILHPITKRSTISMQKMGKMGPEMERLKKKYADNKDELNKAMMTFYKEQGFTPVLGCLPMFLQMPIWIALWGALQSTFDLRQEPFLWGWTWIKDLAKPDALITFKQPIHLLFFTIASINILPVLMAIVYFLQQKYTPKPPASTKEQEQQQKMMQWMTLLFPVMLYGGPAGLNLYIVTSAGIGIIESKRIRDHIKQREEDEKAGRIIVDAKPTRGARRGDGGATEPAKKPNPLAQWIAEMMAKADRVRDDARKRKP